MTDSSKGSGTFSSQTTRASEPALPRAPTGSDPLHGPRADLARVIPRRVRVKWWMGILLALGFAVLVMPAMTAERLFGEVRAGQPAPVTVRVPPFAGYETPSGHLGRGGGIVIARGEIAQRDDEIHAIDVAEAMPHGAAPYLVYLLLAAVFAGLFAHHTRRSNRGRLLRVQLVSLALITVAAIAVKLLMLTTAISVLVVPVAVFAIVPTLVLDRVVGLATGTLAALTFSLVVPFDVTIAILLLVQAGTAGLMVAERPKHRWRAALVAGGAATVFTGITYPLMMYLTTGHLPLAELHAPLQSAWLASVIGPAVAMVIAVPIMPLYQLLVGEITHGKLVHLEDLSHPLLRQISEKAPGSWQHSLMMANMAEIAANAIGANGRLVRVGAYYHDLGKSLAPKYFIENLEPGETSPHDQLPPETSCEAIFKHVTEGIIAARRAGLHERIIDFMHMHHGNGVLEYFWAKCREQGNASALTVEHFRYPGVPPQSRETAILAVCDAVEAASRTLKKPEPAAIDNLVQRIVYGKLHLGQLDESGLSMSDLRKVSDSLRETIRHANHGRIEYPWQKAEQDASATTTAAALTTTGPRLDSLDRPAKADAVRAPSAAPGVEPFAETDVSGGATPSLRGKPAEPKRPEHISSELALGTTTPVKREPPPKPSDPGISHDAALARAWRADAGASDAVPTQAAEADTGRHQSRSGPAASRESASPLVKKFAAEAVAALDEASKDLQILPPSAADSKEIEIVRTSGLDIETPSAARKRAATLPPIRRAPTVPPTPTMIGRHAPTLPPIPTMVGRPPTMPPPIAQVTLPPPGVQRAPAMIVDDPADASTTAPRMHRVSADDAGSTQPRMAHEPDADDTQPRLELPLMAPAVSHPGISLRDVDPPIDPPRAQAATTKPTLETTWARGLAARLDRQLDDDEFGADTPVVAPTKAEIQALLGSPLDATRQQSIDEIEALHRATRDRQSDPHLQQTRRAPYPTAEVDEADIESAIELAPPARRNAIGVAKKKPTE